MVVRLPFDFFKMRAIFKLLWVRRLIGKPGVPYNRRLGVRGSPHPLVYDDDLSLPAADSNAFRIQSDLFCPACCIAALIGLASTGVKRAANSSPLAFSFPILGRPSFFFIFVNKYVDSNLVSVNNNVNKENDMANILKAEKKVAAISMLCEGASIRAVERITGIHGDTIGRLALRIGQACKAIRMTPAQAAGIESSAWTVEELVKRCGE
jgi:hypothetical protein